MGKYEMFIKFLWAMLIIFGIVFLLDFLLVSHKQSWPQRIVRGILDAIMQGEKGVH